MLNRLHRARIPLHHLVQPPPAPPPPRRAISSVKGKEKEQIQPSRTTRNRSSTRSIDWSKPSTSAIPYSPPTRRSYSTSNPSPSADVLPRQLERLLSCPPSSTLLGTIASSLATLSRSSFDLFFDKISESPLYNSTHLRQIKSIAERKRGWKLDERQLRMVLEASLKREKEKRVNRIMVEQSLTRHKGRNSSDEPKKQEEEKSEQEGGLQDDREKALWAERKRQNVSDSLFKEYLELVSNPKKVSKKDHRRIREVLELFATCAAIRPVSSTRDQDGQALFAFSLALDYSKRSEETVVIENDVAEVVRRMLGNGREEEALAFMAKMADKRRILTVKVMRDIVTDYYVARGRLVDSPGGQNRSVDTNLLTRFDETTPSGSASRINVDPKDEYYHARRVLDQVCESTSSAGLDDLLRLRLERLDRLEELERNPRGAFLRWMTVKGDGKKEWVETALKIWAAGVEKGDQGEDLVGRSYRKVLEGLVIKACEVGKVTSERPEAATLVSSPLIDSAVNLSIRHFPLQVLTHHSHLLIRALTVDSHSPDLACDLFDLVNSPPADFSFARFQWSATLLTPFTRLFFSSRRYEKDPSLPIRLYLSWTASGLTFPAGLWDPFWRSLGRGGSIDDLERVLQDWEETGRGPATSRIVHQVLQGAIHSGNVPRSLELFGYFRSRYAPSSSSSPVPAFRRSVLDPLVVALESYNSLLNLLARSRTDYRTTLHSIFSSFIFDGHSPSTETYNALLASNLIRTTFSVSDIDSAGVVYNKMVQTGLKPDRDTFGLLVGGFNRMVREGTRGRQGGGRRSTEDSKRKVVGIEASLRTFRASLVPLDNSESIPKGMTGRSRDKGRVEGGEARVQTLARGGPVGELMKILAEEGRFEEAKQVGEEWWRALIRLEEVVGSKGFWEGREVKDECAEMRKAGIEIEKLERRSIDREEGVKCPT